MEGLTLTDVGQTFSDIGQALLPIFQEMAETISSAARLLQSLAVPLTIPYVAKMYGMKKRALRRRAREKGVTFILSGYPCVEYVRPQDLVRLANEE